ncbi:phage portal protein, partial [Escherichia coli]|nr:phage portal protein [Escherichia coli]EGP3296897.1 phage portal protein [Escherichia coli]EKP3529828.1 phage portal protein [Escherichia coli]
MWNPFRKKAIPQPVSQQGWKPLLRFTGEPYPGAWQRDDGRHQDTVLAYHAVFACISLIAGDIAKMRPRVMRRDRHGVPAEVRTGSAAVIYRRPNAFQNRIQFFEQWVSSKLCHGNTVALKIRNSRGETEALRLLDWGRVTPMVADDGSVFYQISP